MQRYCFDILGVKIDAINLSLACEVIDYWIKTSRNAYICVAPVSTIVSCQEDAAYKEVINQADMVTPDGMPVVWLGRLKGHREVKRTYGPDLMLALCTNGLKKGYRHFLYGGTPETCIKLEDSLRERLPSIQIVGKYSPPFHTMLPQDQQEVVEMINQAKPDIVWVGLGSPKQDFWMKQNRGKLSVPVMIGVGAAFDFLSGMKQQAPRWMQRSGLEWLFRLGCEPRRLWKRYLIGNVKFVYFLIKDSLR